jgi:hypothetical protein
VPLRSSLALKAQIKSGNENSGANKDRDVDAELQSVALEKSCKISLTVKQAK